MKTSLQQIFDAEMKCYNCKKRRKLYTLSIDPDIAVAPRCKECMDKLVLEMQIKLYLND